MLIADDVVRLRMEGYRFKQLRLERHLSQEKFSEIIGVTQQAVCKYEKGLSVPSKDVLELMCDHFGCSMDYILGRSDYRLPAEIMQEEETKEDAERLISYYNELENKDKQRLMKIAELLAEVDRC